MYFQLPPRRISNYSHANLVKCLWQTIFPTSTPHENRVWAELSRDLRKAWELNSEFAMYVHTKYFPSWKALKFKVNYPVTLGLIALGLLPNSPEEWWVALWVNIGYFCVPAPQSKMFLQRPCSWPGHSTAQHAQAPLAVCSFPVGSGHRLPCCWGLFSLCHPASLLKPESKSSSTRKDRAQCISKAKALLAVLLQLQPMEPHWARLRDVVSCLPHSAPSSHTLCYHTAPLGYLYGTLTIKHGLPLSCP